MHHRRQERLLTAEPDSDGYTRALRDDRLAARAVQSKGLLVREGPAGSRKLQRSPAGLGGSGALSGAGLKSEQQKALLGVPGPRRRLGVKE